MQLQLVEKSSRLNPLGGGQTNSVHSDISQIFAFLLWISVEVLQALKNVFRWNKLREKIRSGIRSGIRCEVVYFGAAGHFRGWYLVKLMSDTKKMMSYMRHMSSKLRLQRCCQLNLSKMFSFVHCIVGDSEYIKCSQCKQITDCKPAVFIYLGHSWWEMMVAGLLLMLPWRHHHQLQRENLQWIKNKWILNKIWRDLNL